MIGAGHVIAFFIGAFVGRYLENFIDLFRKARDDFQDIRGGKN